MAANTGIDGLWAVCSLAAVSLPLAVSMYTRWRRSTERKVKSDVKGRVLLPTPRYLLPAWLGSISGHSLLLEREKLMQQLEGWADEYEGDYELNILGRRIIVVADRVEIRRLLFNRPSMFKRGFFPSHFVWPAKQFIVENSMFFAEGKEWGRSRRIIAPSMNHQNVMDMVSGIAQIAERLCSKWSRMANAGTVISAGGDTMRYTHDVLSHAALGLGINSLDAKPGEACPSYDAVRSNMAALQRLLLEPLSQLGWVYMRPLLPWARTAARDSARLRRAALNAIGEARRQIRVATDSHDKVPDDIGKATKSSAMEGKVLRKIVQSNDSSRGGNGAMEDGGRRAKANPAGGAIDRMSLSDEHIVQEVHSIFVAGTETTSNTLSWALYFVAKYPEIHDRCRQEALRVAPETNGIVNTKEQLMQLAFCSAVIKETFRLKSSSTMLLTHSTGHFELVNGAKVDENTGVILLTNYAGKQEEAFTRAKEFVPQRFIEAEREAALLGQEAGDKARTVRHIEDALLGFGAGPRECPGKDLARAEAVIVLAGLCARFDLALAPGQPDPPEDILSFASGPERVELVVTEV